MASLSVLDHADGSQNDAGGSGNGADDSEYKTQLRNLFHGVASFSLQSHCHYSHHNNTGSQSQ